MKLKFYTEQVLTVLLVVVILPWMITMLLHGKMSQIYEKIQRETRYISVKSGDETGKQSVWKNTYWKSQRQNCLRIRKKKR